MDYLLLWWKSEGDLKMSRQDQRDEMKQTEGNPQSKARVRRMQRQSRRKQMLKAAETATVVITNPTHYAVALRYEQNMSAPIVVAKGLDNLAAKIKGDCLEQGYSGDGKTGRWRRRSTRALRSGDPIPSALYHAVAEILVPGLQGAERSEKPSGAEKSRARHAPKHDEDTVNKPQKPGLMGTLRKYSEWIIPTGAVALVCVMLVPMPSVVLDILLTLNITASVLVLLTAIQVLKPVEFSVFPSLILLLTLMRLSLDLAATRRILLHGGEGASAAGSVIEAFGQFVVGGNYIVGFVIFLALIAIQYLVVSHGAVRTAEVTARFTLDAMPGKQMAIDSDLNTGLINAEQARQRREAVSREAEFCGAMDGAARFSQRDSLATILIMAINIIAGFLIGVFQQGIPFQEALKTYTILTVGDGLVAIIPALLVSVAGGIVVTRAASDRSLGAEIEKQMFRSARPLWIVSGCLLSLALIPGMPKVSFILLGGVIGFAAWKLKPTAAAEAAAGAKPATAAGAKPGAPAADPMDAVLKLDELMLEVGVGLVPLVDAKQGGQLLSRVKSLRKNLAQTLGFLGSINSHH